jgi:hypothetical protein
MSSGYTTGWQEDLIDYLISAGTVGRNTSEILRRFQNRVASDQITGELESYQVEGRVQKFTYPPKGGKGRPTTVWRATTKMVELDDVQTKKTKKVKSSKVNKKTNGKAMGSSRSGKRIRHS